MPYAHIMSSAKWQQLPNDLKTIMTEVTDRMFPDILCKAAQEEQNEGIKIVILRCCSCSLIISIASSGSGIILSRW
jgi:hypothetical protein